MARNNTPAQDGEDFPSRTAASRFDEADDATGYVEGFQDPASEEPSPFLRKQKRVPARRGPLPRKAAGRLKFIAIFAVLLVIAAAAFMTLDRYLHKAARFRLESSDHIEIVGTDTVSRAQVMEVFGGDISRNIFAIPLDERKRQIEQIPWVESASLMRFMPDRLRVQIKERTPLAFAQIGTRIGLIDAYGVVMDNPETRKYSFPVVTGLTDADLLAMRAARMKIYTAVMRELDGGGARYSQDVEEIDLGDPDDVKIFVHDAATGGGVLVHLGSSNYLDRYKLYIANAAKWRQQVGELHSVDMRYDRQVIVNADPPPASATQASAPAPAPAAVSETPAAEPPAAEPAKTAPPAVKPDAKHAQKTAALRHRRARRAWRKPKPAA